MLSAKVRVIARKGERKTSKLIIYNESELSDILAIDLVKKIVGMGRISNYGKNYSYVTTFRSVVVYADRNKHSDVFRVRNKKEG